jgi:hypothetical protein
MDPPSKTEEEMALTRKQADPREPRLQSSLPPSPIPISIQKRVTIETLGGGILTVALGMIGIVLFFSAPFYQSFGSAFSFYDLVRGGFVRAYTTIVAIAPDLLPLLFICASTICAALGFYGILANGRASPSTRKTSSAVIAVAGVIMMFVCIVELFMFMTGAHGTYLPSWLPYSGHLAFTVTDPGWGIFAGAANGWLLIAVNV